MKKTMDISQILFWEGDLLSEGRGPDGNGHYRVSLDEKVHKFRLRGTVILDEDDASVASVDQDDFCLMKADQLSVLLRLFPYLLSAADNSDGAICHFDLTTLLNRKPSDPDETKRILRAMEIAIRTFK